MQFYDEIVNFEVLRSENSGSRQQLLFEAKLQRQNAPVTAAAPLTAPPLKPNRAILLYAASEGDSNMLYAAGFFVPDPFIYFQHKNIRFVVM
ncbi:MAG: hypothetical protein ACREP5_15425, partial [Candidatus Binatia bacterium]